MKQETKKGIVHQFNEIRQKRSDAKKKLPPYRGPVDLKEARKMVHGWNKKNRMPT